ncbi:MAG TPA: hypothetical protein ENF82_01445 [Candidatus Methanomethylia archaeon]|nr:hypothetical protein [Candidatus Methanomethylicia archaeon]
MNVNIKNAEVIAANLTKACKCLSSCTVHKRKPSEGRAVDDFELLKRYIMEGEDERAREVALKLVEKGCTPMDVVRKAIKPAMDELGRRFERLEAFLPELMLAAEAVQEVLKAVMPEGKQGIYKGKVVIGTIYGDIHDIGKNIVASMLRASGYEIIDLGSDVHPDTFVEVAKREGANIIGISCLLTPSMYYMRDVIKRLADEGIRDRFHVVVGGAAVYPEWAKEIGADGWAKDADKAVQLCDTLLEKGKKSREPLIFGEWR